MQILQLLVRFHLLVGLLFALPFPNPKLRKHNGKHDSGLSRGLKGKKTNSASDDIDTDAKKLSVENVDAGDLAGYTGV